MGDLASLYLYIGRMHTLPETQISCNVNNVFVCPLCILYTYLIQKKGRKQSAIEG